MAVGSSITSLLRTTAPLLLLLATTSRAHERSLSGDLVELLPSCAQECFRSYIDVNYDGLDCGAVDSLQCACATRGTSGFTLGEGAVQCLVGAANVGLCTGADVDKTRLNLSYSMCKNEPEAVLPTHTVIQATLRLDKSSRLVVSPPSETPSPTAEPSAPATTTADSISTQDPQTSTSKPVLLPVPTGAESSPSDLEPEPKTDGDGQPGSALSTAQIAGLAAGLGAAVGIAMIAICLARRRRRRLDGDVETGFFLSSEKLKVISSRFSRAPPRANSISAPLGGSGPPVFPMGPHGPARDLSRTVLIPPVPASGPSAAAPMMAAASIRPSGSPPRNPNRPVLSLAIPKNNTSPARIVPGRTSTVNNPPAGQQSPQAGGNPTIKVVRGSIDGNANTNADSDNGNDSPMTEFEEDDRNSPVQVWRPPSAVPQSATTMYVADKWGNWVLADERRRKRISIAELEGTTPPRPAPALGAVAGVAENAGAVKATESMTQATAGGLRPPAEIYRQGEAGRGGIASNASSMYSSDARGWSPAAAPPVPSNPMMPRPLVARQGSRSYSRPLNSARTTAYSPALNPFLDENGISPVRSGEKSQRRPGPPGLLIGRPGSQSAFQVPVPRIRSPPGQPSPTLGSPPRDTTTPRDAAYANVPSPSRTQTQSPPQPRRESQTHPRPQYTYPQPPAPLFIPDKPRHPSAGTPSEDSPSSSLLAKRLGPDRAAGLVLRPEGLVTPQQWSGRGPAPGASSGQGGEEAPISPIWKPLLTPERRGDDLFLSLHLT